MERHNSGVGRQEGSELAIGLVLLVVMTAGVGVLSSSEGAVERAVAPGVGQASSSTTRFGGGPPWWPALQRGSEGSFTTATVPATSPTTRETTATARACRVSDLRVTLEGSQGAGGTNYTPLAFKNRSSSRCALTGHPKVSFLDQVGSRDRPGRAHSTGYEGSDACARRGGGRNHGSWFAKPRGLPTGHPGDLAGRSTRRRRGICRSAEQRSLRTGWRRLRILPR
jgi:hypothetical protein